jgi:hypothetical protein
MSANRNPKPDPNAGTSNQDVLPQGGDASTGELEQDATTSTDSAPLSTDTTKNPVIINR